MGRVGRYNYLYKTIEEHNCKSIFEIGTCRCESAIPMIEAASKAAGKHGDVVYYGFDLFETMTEDIFLREKSKKSFRYVQALKCLKTTPAEIHLFMGRSILSVPYAIEQYCIRAIDLIFIDGGHFYETVKADWNNVQRLISKNTIVIIDDYMPDKAFGIGPATVVDEIDREKFIVTFPEEAVDCCSRMAKVVKRGV